ncbi:MAG: LamG domain-containing protein, partial [Lentisphaerae bacterium]
FSLRVAPAFPLVDGPVPGVVGSGRQIGQRPLRIPHQPELDPAVFTLECWVKIPQRFSDQLKNCWLIGKNRNEFTEGNFGLLFNCSKKLEAVMNIGGGARNVFRIELSSKTKFRVGQWHHLAISYDGDVFAFYVDGRLAGRQAIHRQRRPGRDALCLGQRPDGRGKLANVMVDEIRIWKRALSQDTLRRHAMSPERYDRRSVSWVMDFNDLQAPARPNLDGARIRMRFGSWQINSPLIPKWSLRQEKEFVLHCPVKPEPWRKPPCRFVLKGSKGRLYPVNYEEHTGGYVAQITKVDRDWKGGQTDIRNYDEFFLEVDNPQAQTLRVPVLFDLSKGTPANITGLVPILCDERGYPTGIPVQLSKNWHKPPAYAKFYTMLPLRPGRNRYRLRIAYGFWGTLPSASHAQLSLFGYGGNGRWDQLAIGCWGETMCFNVDYSLPEVMICDVRMLFTRNGKDGRLWGWSDGGWGGDWLQLRRPAGSKLFPVAQKTAYLAQGPCLTDVRYAGYYGKNQDVRFDAAVAIPRTDDHNQVYQRLRYRFKRSLSAKEAYFFRMGPNWKLVTPRVAYGNRDGLLTEQRVPGNLARGTMFRDNIVLTGNAPWWIAFPGSYLNDPKRNWGTGSRALIIHSYRAVLGGKTYTHPVIAFPVLMQHKSAKGVGCDLYVKAPLQVTRFMPGDEVEMVVEWITVPRVAEDYYGPNKAFLKHLQENPRSWRTVYREAIGKNPAISVRGGEVQQRIPLVVKVNRLPVEVSIRGGVGVFPIRFEGLKNPRRWRFYRKTGNGSYPLGQEVHGHDYWQTDYDPETRTFKLSFNLPLDGLKESTWILDRQ